MKFSYLYLLAHCDSSVNTLPALQFLLLQAAGSLLTSLSCVRSSSCERSLIRHALGTLPVREAWRSAFVELGTLFAVAGLWPPSRSALALWHIRICS